MQMVMEYIHQVATLTVTFENLLIENSGRSGVDFIKYYKVINKLLNNLDIIIILI